MPGNYVQALADPQSVQVEKSSCRWSVRVCKIIKIKITLADGLAFRTTSYVISFFETTQRIPYFCKPLIIIKGDVGWFARYYTRPARSSINHSDQ